MRYLTLATLLLIAGCVAAPAFKGADVANFDGEQFINRTPMTKTITDMMSLGWGMVTEASPWPTWIEIEPQSIPEISADIGVTFVNHSTLLIQIDGLNILTDPIWADRASPFQWAGPKRVHAPGVKLQDLPHIDIVLISHNHYDHLDEATLIALADQQETAPLVITGLGNGLLLEELGLPRYQELNWNENIDVGELTVTFTECRHRSGRGLTDQMKTLWGSFVIESPSGNLYFAGDTGFDRHFADAGETFGEFELALLPIGAYEPRWFMADVHLNPLEAVVAHKQLNAKQSVGIHFGTFQLTYEAIDTPMTELAQALSDEGVATEDFIIMQVGETRAF